MTDSSSTSLPDPSHRFFRIGAITSITYVTMIAIYAFAVWQNMLAMKPDEFATFLAGVFSPVAFLWLVLGFLQQGQELRQSSKALWLQGEELRNSVEQQRNLVDVTRQQLDFERERIGAEFEQAKVRAQPNLKFGGGGSMTSGPTNTMMMFWLLNRGPSCTDCEVTWAGKTYLRDPLFPAGEKRDFNIEIMGEAEEGDSEIMVTYIDGLGYRGKFTQPAKIVTQGDRKYMRIAE